MAENKNAKTPADDGQPVAWMMVNKVIGPPSLHWKTQEDWHITWECKPLYTAPPKQWVGLTDQEMRECAQAMNAEPLAEGWPKLIKLARAIEAKLRDKNHG